MLLPERSSLLSLYSGEVLRNPARVDAPSVVSLLQARSISSTSSRTTSARAATLSSPRRPSRNLQYRIMGMGTKVVSRKSAMS